MKSQPFDLGIVACGSPAHLADIEVLQQRQLAVPHDYSTWPLNSKVGSWTWCRILDPAGNLLSGFSVHLSSSRAIPGTRIGRIDRIGRNLHEGLADVMGAVLTEAARKIPRLLRLDARVFDEDPVRRHRFYDSLAAAGWIVDTEHREYSNTLVLKLADTKADVLKGFSTRVRSTIKKALGSPALRYAPVVGTEYVNRIRHLYILPFSRTGGVPPPIDIEGILRDAASDKDSLLLGAFARDVPPPNDLVAVLWGRLHGDHSVVEINASERSAVFDNCSPGFGLMAELIEWSIQHNAQWVDMGGLSSLHPAADDPMRGIIEFKTRFTTDFRPVAEEWHLAPNSFLAAAAGAVRSIAKSVSGARQSLERRP